MVICPECGKEYDSIGLHWYHNSEHRPRLTDYQKELVTGILMGDGYINRSNKTPFFEVRMITKEYLEWLDDIFGIMSTGVYLKDTASESAQHARDTGFTSTVNEENYHDYWRMETRCHPEFSQFNWYVGGEKVWPKNIELTPTVLTHLYVTDGHWDNKGGSNRILITATNEDGNKNKIDSYFDNAGLPLPSGYENNGNGMNIAFYEECSQELWDYMDDPPPGFEYKFPEEYR